MNEYRRTGCSNLDIPDTAKYVALHTKLKGLAIAFPSDISTDSIRGVFNKIRENRNIVARIMGNVFPALGRAKSALARIDRIIDAESFIIRDSGEGMLGTKNEKDRQARVGILLDDLFDLKTDAKRAVSDLQELANHCKVVMDEMRALFEEISRTLSTYELDYRISKVDKE